MIGKLDKEIIEKFKAFQEKTGKHSELYIEDVEFENKKLEKIINIFDNQRVALSGNERNTRKGKYPYYGASGIIDYIDDYIYDGRYLIVSEDGENLIARKTPIAFFASGKFWVNNHAHILKGKENILFDEYLKYFIDSNKLYNYISFSSQPKLSQTNLKKILIPIPKDLNKFYSSYQIQEAIVEFLEYSFKEIEVIRERIDKRYKIFERLKKALIPSTFIKDYVKVAFARYAREKGIKFNILDIVFNDVNFSNFFDTVTPPKKIKNKDAKEKGDFPIVSQSDGLINGHTNEKNGYIDAKTEPLIIFGDHTTIVKYVNFKFFAGADGTKILKPKNTIISKYAYYQSVNRIKQQGYQRHFQYFKNEIFLIPKDLENYTSLEIQKIIADFIEYTENRLQKEFDRMDRGYHNLERLHKTYLARTFSLINWGVE